MYYVCKSDKFKHKTQIKKHDLINLSIKTKIKELQGISKKKKIKISHTEISIAVAIVTLK